MPLLRSVNEALQQDLESLSQDTLLQDSSGETLGEGVRNELNDSYTDLLREHPNLPRFPLSAIRASPYTLPTGFQWSTCDLTNEYTCDEICSLLKTKAINPHALYNNSKSYLRWSLCPPGYFADWHVGVRRASFGNLIGFVSAVPTRIRVRDVVFPMAVLHHLCVHHFEEEAIPRTVLLSEILRRVNSNGIWQQVYRWESFLPAPIAVSGLWKRDLDLRKLRDLHFNTPRTGMQITEIVRRSTLPDFTGRPGIRKMRPSDVPTVTVLLRDYLSRFAVAPVFTEEEVVHLFLPKGDMLDSFVIETSGNNPEITDFFSYTRQKTRPCGKVPLTIARLFYFATRTTPLSRLIRDALLAAIYHHCSLFVTDEFKNNERLLAELRFERTLRKVQYNLNNYPMDVLPTFEVGLSLLFPS